MNACIISIDHSLQYIEIEAEDQTLRAAKYRLRVILSELLSTGQINSIFEESSPTKPSIAQEVAKEAAIPWHNICMTKEERIDAGIYDALRNRPGSPDWETMSYWIERRIPEDAIREAYFVKRIEEATTPTEHALILLGDMHVQQVAKALSNLGHRVRVVQELVPIRRWVSGASSDI